MESSLKIPKFATETEEANWWFENRKSVEENFRVAMKEGRTGQGTLMRRALAADSVVQLDAEDASRARAAAERKGMQYQAYVKMLIHEALDREADAA